MAAIDFSDLGGVPTVDFSDLGGQPVGPITQAVGTTNPVGQTLGLIPRVAGDITSGLATAGQGLANTPANIANWLRGVSPSIANAIPQQPTSNINFQQVFGINNPNGADNLIQNAAQYAPYGIVGEGLVGAKALSSAPSLMSRLVQQVPIGGVFGATQSTNPVQGGLAGMGANALFSGVGSLANSVSSPIKSFLSNYSAPAIASNVGNAMDNVRTLSNQDAFNMAKQNFNDFSNREKLAWNNVSNVAKNLDSPLPTGGNPPGNTNIVGTQNPINTALSTVNKGIAPTQWSTFNKELPNNSQLTNPSPLAPYISPREGAFIPADSQPNSINSPADGNIIGTTYNKYPFDNSTYINALKNRLNILQNQSNNQSAYARANAPSISLLQDYIGDQHNSFSDAIDHNKSLNQDFQNEIAPGQPLPFKTVNFAKSALQNTLQDNINKYGLDDTLGVALDNANTITSMKNQLFNQVINPNGQPKISNFSGFVNGKTQFSDPTSFVNDYLPKSNSDGIQKMQQFSQMIGDPDYAKDIIKSNYFNNAYKNNNFNPKSFLPLYNKLSPEQQNYLFDPNENASISALNNIMTDDPKALNRASWNILSHGGGATGGLAIGFESGHPLLGLAAGVGLPNAFRFGMQQLFKSPRMRNMAVNYLNNGAQNMGPSAFTQNALPAVTTPYLTGLAGNQ